MDWEVDGQSAKRLDDIAKAAQGRRRPDPRHRPGSRGRGDLLARARGAASRSGALKDKPVERVVFNAITKQSVLEAMRQSAPDRRRAGRRLSGPPRARLSGRLHAVAGAVAQAAGRPLGRPRAVGGAAPGLRPRGRDRALPPPGILDRSTATFGHRARRGASRRASPPSTAQEARQARHLRRGSGPTPSRQRSTAPTFTRRLGRSRSRPSAIRRPALHHLDAAAGGLAQARLLRRAHHADRPAALRGRRHRRRDRRPDHLYAHRRRADGARGDRRGAQRHRARASASATCRRSRALYTTKAKNAQEAHEAIRPTDLFARTPASVRQYLDADQARLYELIWKRDRRRARWRAAEIERTTVDIDAPTAHGTRCASAPPARSCASTASSTLYHGRPRRRREDEDSAPPAARSRAATRSALTAIAADAAFHRAAAALFRGQPGQEDGGARHRPALDLCRDPDDAARTATMSRIDKQAAHPRGQGPAASPPSSRASSSATSNTTSPPISRKSSTRSPPASSTGRRCCAISGATSPAAVGEIKELRVTRSARRARRGAGAAYLPGRRGRRRSARLPDLRHRPAVAEARQVRRLHRLLELSRMPLHPPARRRRRRRRTRADAGRRQAARRSIPRPARR